MKLHKTASGKTTVKMSRSEWESLGKKAGWTPEQDSFRSMLLDAEMNSAGSLGLVDAVDKAYKLIKRFEDMPSALENSEGAIRAIKANESLLKNIDRLSISVIKNEIPKMREDKADLKNWFSYNYGFEFEDLEECMKKIAYLQANKNAVIDKVKKNLDIEMTSRMDTGHVNVDEGEFDEVRKGPNRPFDI